MDVYSKLRHKWFVYLTGEKNDQGICKQTLDAININAQTARDGMDRSIDGLWAECTNSETSARITVGYRNIEKMALSYSTPCTLYYKNYAVLQDILYALQWYYENLYNEQSEYYDNWWHWDIGAPQALCNIVTLLYDQIDPKARTNYMNAVERFDYDPRYNRKDRKVSTAANRLDLCKIVILRGILVEKPEKIRLGVEVGSTVLQYVTNGEGFYRDGSFIQHVNIPYTASYGMVLIEAISQLLYVLSDTPWQFSEQCVDIVYEWIFNSYLPVIHKGLAMDCVRGRAVSRSFLQDHTAGHRIIRAMATIALNTSHKLQSQLLGIVKQLLLSDTFLSFYHSANLYYLNVLHSICENESISCVVLPPKHYHFAMMDRVVHKTDKYTFALSMYSKRIQNYEDMLDENKKAWHTSDGCVYIYNDDLSAYNDGYWATVDHKRLSGTTVDAKQLPLIPASEGVGFQQVSSKSWVGGCVIDELYGCAGMELETPFSSLTCRKSWFMMQNYIICLGSSITSADDNSIETIIENRKINSASVITAKNRVCIKGETAGNSIGYMILDHAQPTVFMDNRQGSWFDINRSMSKQSIKNDFATILIDHGVQPKNASYAYAIVPCCDDIANMSVPVQIIMQDDCAHGVYDCDLKITAINFWQNKIVRCNNITCDSQASVMLRKTREGFTVSVSDPTMENDGVITLHLHESLKNVVYAHENITCEIAQDFAIIKASVANTNGQPLSVKISI